MADKAVHGPNDHLQHLSLPSLTRQLFCCIFVSVICGRGRENDLEKHFWKKYLNMCLFLGPRQPFQLLLSVIRSLSVSENEEAKEEERKKLEMVFQKSDAKLKQLVASAEKNIRSVMEVKIGDSVINHSRRQFSRFSEYSTELMFALLPPEFQRRRRRNQLQGVLRAGGSEGLFFPSVGSRAAS